MIVEVPLILAVTAAQHVSLTPPNAPPSTKEMLKTVSPAERFFAQMLPYMTGSTKFLGWVAAAVEVAGVVAIKHPATSFGRAALDGLTRIGLRPTSAFNLTAPRLAACGLAIAGCLVRVQCYRTLGRFFTFELSMFKEHQLCTSGPYAVVRHPSYTGVLMTLSVSFLWVASRGSLLLNHNWLDTGIGKAALWAFCLEHVYTMVSITARTGAEDRALKEQFGAEWDHWAARVPYRLLPGIY